MLLSAALTNGACAADDGPEEVEASSAKLEIPAGGTEIDPKLGSGWDSGKERFIAQCVDSPVVEVGGVSADVDFEHSMSKTQAQSSLGMKVGMKAKYGLYNGSLNADAARSMEADSRSEVLIYRANYNLGTQSLDENAISLTNVGRSAQTNDLWPVACGDQVVYQIKRGGRFFLLFRLDFSSKEVKEEFNADINLSAPFGDASAEIHEKAYKYAEKATVSVSAYQFGGDPTQISAIISGVSGGEVTPEQGTENVRAAISCGIENLAACDTFMINALNYATNTSLPLAFPTQLHDRPNPISYVTLKWQELAIGQLPFVVGEELKGLRRTLENESDRNLSVTVRVDHLLKSGFLTATQASELQDWQERLEQNAVRVLEAASACYDEINYQEPTASVTQCLNKVNAINLELPPDDLLDSYGSERFILLKWAETGGVDGPLGQPLPGDAGLIQAGPNNGLWRAYQGGNIYWNIETGAQVVKNPILVKYAPHLSGSDPFLGYPVSEEEVVDGGVKRQEFQDGFIYAFPGPVTAILQTRLHDRWTALDGAAGVLGRPAGDSTKGTHGNAVELYQRFDGGSLYWRAPRGVLLMKTPILNRWLALRNSGLNPGYPSSDDTPGPAGGSWTVFDSGNMYYHPDTGAKVVLGASKDKYVAVGGPTLLGYPTGNTVPTGDGGWYTTFQTGAVFSKGTQTHEIRGEILAKWDALGLHLSSLGIPITDQKRAWSGSGGLYNDFERGSIYWSQATGAWQIPTKIRDKWRAAASGRTCGFPIEAPKVTTHHFPIENRVTSQRFQNGIVSYSDIAPTPVLNCP